MGQPARLLPLALLLPELPVTARTKSFFKFFYWRQVLIPVSTVINGFTEYDRNGSHGYNYLSVYVFGFRICCFHYVPK